MDRCGRSKASLSLNIAGARRVGGGDVALAAVQACCAEATARAGPRDTRARCDLRGATQFVATDSTGPDLAAPANADSARPSLAKIALVALPDSAGPRKTALLRRTSQRRHFDRE